MADVEHPHAIRTVWWQQDGQQVAVCMIDQSLLPGEVVILTLTHEQEVAEAIRTLRVRGAPAIGVTAAFGMALAISRLLNERGDALTVEQAEEHLRGVGELLRGTRPTAVNLAWGVERMLRRARQAISGGCTPSELARAMHEEAQAIADEDFEACVRMGEFGATLIADGDTLLTHCNAGWLATAGWGTALAPVYVAHRSGKKLHIFVDETRPVLQGARLTTWELQREGIPLTLITDNMAAHFMRHGGIKGVFVGADRIAANGDVANKIGTYSVAVLARAHSIPLYVVAPRSTIDLSLASGESIPIEQRNPDEVTSIQGIAIAPAGVHAANPAFDITPDSYVAAIVTEAGIARPPYEQSLRALCAGYAVDGEIKA
ncbi:MAG TPA: S-methyl-5-thioribose-1-phosphate isomerase [Ktedonobacteraceae bacterium]|nr:S-methyl-5-thioribose-1-phosphate isomerase [Ktedonobacteraceae bacterium]